MDSFRSIMALWPSRTAFATDLGRRVGTVRMWASRNIIPAEFWVDVVARAEQRGFEGVTLDRLAELAARRRERSVDTASERSLAETANA